MLCDRSGTLSRFCMSNIDVVTVLFNLIRASREDKWILHLSSIKEMVSWCFAYFLLYIKVSPPNAKFIIHPTTASRIFNEWWIYLSKTKTKNKKHAWFDKNELNH